MKKTTIAALVAVSALGLSACQKEEQVKEQAVKLETQEQKQAYGLGASVGKFVDQKLDMQEEVNVDLNRDMVIRGFVDALTAESKMGAQQVQEELKQLDALVKEKQQVHQDKLAEQNIQKGEAFLEKNAQKDSVTVTDSGLQYEVLEQGEGEKPTKADTVKVHYKGTLLDGTTFDSSYDRGEPAVFPLGRVIQGWIEGVQLMNVGSKYKFYIPSDLAYGERGNGKISPNSTLIFEVELLAIEDDAAE